MNLETLCQAVNAIAGTSTTLTETLRKLDQLIKEHQ